MLRSGSSAFISGVAGSGSSDCRSTNPPYTSRPIAGPISALEIARVDPSVTRAESPVASARTQPVTVTVPEGGSGTSSTAAAPLLPVASHPRSTSSAGPSAGWSGTTTSTPELPSRVR